MFPEPYKVGHRVRSVTHDGMAQGEAWAAATDLPVYGWGPPSPDDVLRAEQTGVEHVLDVYCKQAATKHRDKLIVNGVEYFVQGEPDDFNHGPFGFKPGVRIRLSKVVG